MIGMGAESYSTARVSDTTMFNLKTNAGPKKTLFRTINNY
jgi:hypothetical protein